MGELARAGYQVVGVGEGERRGQPGRQPARGQERPATPGSQREQRGDRGERGPGLRRCCEAEQHTGEDRPVPVGR